ncbi:hypothetical protein CDD81_7252 [Ophiocordyceps australis]|uniref:Asl1-like glycosyl hydrolase catalytic domain-containing protein n=1 Tax=Ophiocordyceps australis TaxID=1399860 RepID=A0A2C5Y520_9HYPO|nr:hypothetical protein CDD81_7252 [Ophiocordyceps australis]
MVALVNMALVASSKRGLCFTPDKTTPKDNAIWIKPGSSIKWYYNYGSIPSPAYSHLSQDDVEYVPMMWGIGPDAKSTQFLDQIKALVHGGTNISHVLGFNEPDVGSDVGGSQIQPRDAAEAWVANFEPLAQMGIKLGLPACSGGWGGMAWLHQFLGNCSERLSTPQQRRNCTWDFLPVHWYDNFAGLASHIGQRRGVWPEAEIWVTEYAYAHQDLETTQAFYNQSIDYFEKLDYMGRYSYFGAFRASKANVGPNGAFLSAGGQLTDIGAWYLGFGATGVKPESTQSWAAAAVPDVVLIGLVACLSLASLALGAAG